MTSTADEAISALRTGHDTLVATLADLPEGGLTGPSGASEWTVADVLSHLGSGAEIGLATLEAALSGTEAPGGDFNQGVWDRWNAMTPQDQADGFVKANEALVTRYESLDEHTRQTQRIKIFLPDPVDVATSAGFRLNEFTLHSWDVRVGGDPAAELAAEAVASLLDVAPYMFGWLGRPKDVLAGKAAVVAVTINDPARAFGLEITDRVALVDSPSAPDASLAIPAEAWLRLVSGRLSPEHTPVGVSATGAVSLDQLRQIFPG
ncbi:MAG: maleylpyruvate isomerase family mycothiol-dependent enzyme, partial [Nakamurella sp.]